MTTVAFDTLKFVERLKASGVPDAQAKAQTEALADVQAAGSQELSTKSDLRDLETRLTSEMKLIRWMVSATFGGVVFILLRLFLPIVH